MSSLHYDLVEVVVHGSGLPNNIVAGLFTVLDRCHCACHYPFHEPPPWTLRQRIGRFFRWATRRQKRAWLWTPRRTPQKHVIACCPEDPTGAPLQVEVRQM